MLAGAGIKGKVAEALKWGVPVVTTSIGAQGFIDQNGALSTSDDPKIMAELISKLLVNDDIWKAKSAASLQLAEKMFSQKTMWDAISSLFKS